MNKTILILLVLVAAQASSTLVKICGSGADDTSSVTIEGCDKPPCVVNMGEKVSLSLKFTPSSPIKNLTAHIQASNWLMNIPILDESICSKIFLARNDSLFPCPLCPEVEYIYKDTITVPTSVPTLFLPVLGIVQLALQTNSETIKCLEVEGKIEN